MSIIAVIGATGYAGGHITAEALSRGHHVIAVSRHGVDRLRSGLTARSGSVHDAGFVAELAAAADAVVVAVKAAPDPDGGLADAVPALLGAAAENGTRLGVVGGAGSLHVGDENGPLLMDTAAFPDVAKREAAGAAEVLATLRADRTGADWFFLSPAAGFGSFAPGERTGSYRTGGDVLLVDTDGNSMISGADYAVAFVDELDEPVHHRERFTVAY